jgi:hypothetical protein
MAKRFAAFYLLAFICFSVTAKASLITGTLNAAGTAELSLGSIAFVSNELFINAPASTQVGGFTALAGTTASIQDIRNPPDATGVLVTPVSKFIVFAAAPNISITFTVLDAGIDGAAGCTVSPAAAGQLCTPDIPAQSPFNFQNTSATSTTLGFDLEGFEVDSLTGDTTPIDGIFTIQLPESFQDALEAINSGQTLTPAFAASFSTPNSTVPEPDTWTAAQREWVCAIAEA